MTTHTAKRWLFLFLVTAAACDGAVEPRGTDAAADDAGPRPIDARPTDAPTPSSCDDWTSEDLGPVELAGSWTCDPSTGVHTVEASGRDIWGTEDELRSLFAQVGPISTLRVVVDRETGKRKGFAFLEFFDQDTAQRAVHELNGVEFYGRALRVSIAEQDTKHGDSSSAPGPSRKRKGGHAGP